MKQQRDFDACCGSLVRGIPVVRSCSRSKVFSVRVARSTTIRSRHLVGDPPSLRELDFRLDAGVLLEEKEQLAAWKELQRLVLREVESTLSVATGRHQNPFSHTLVQYGT